MASSESRDEGMTDSDSRHPLYGERQKKFLNVFRIHFRRTGYIGKLETLRRFSRMRWGGQSTRDEFARSGLRTSRKCAVCVASRIDGLHRHHVIQLQNGGKNIQANIIALCRDCHKKVHASDRQWAVMRRKFPRLVKKARVTFVNDAGSSSLLDGGNNPHCDFEPASL